MGDGGVSWRQPEYDWQKEFYAWAQAKPKEPARMMTPAEVRRRYARPRMADLLTVSYEILDKPEIWDRFVEFARRKNSENPNYRDSEGECVGEYGEDDEYKYARQLANGYSGWFRMKKGLDDHREPYGCIPGIILCVAEGKIDRTDVEAIKNGLRNHADHTAIDETPEFGSKP